MEFVSKTREADMNVMQCKGPLYAESSSLHICFVIVFFPGFRISDDMAEVDVPI